MHTTYKTMWIDEVFEHFSCHGKLGQDRELGDYIVELDIYSTKLSGVYVRLLQVIPNC